MNRNWFVLATLFILGALVVLPAGAAEIFPVLDNQVAMRKAHLAWKSAVLETKMNAAISYVEGLPGADTTELAVLDAEFLKISSKIRELDTHAGLNAAFREMAGRVLSFGHELITQMMQGKGNWQQLKENVSMAVDTDPIVVSLENSYWMTRTTSKIQNLDIHLDRAKELLSVLSARGYDTRPANATLQEIQARREELAAAITAKDLSRIQSIQKDVLTLTQKLTREIRDLRIKVPEEKKIRFWMGVGERAYERAEMIEIDLRTLDLDTQSLDPILSTMKEDLKNVRSALDRQHLTEAKEALSRMKPDFNAFAQAVQGITGERTSLLR